MAAVRSFPPWAHVRALAKETAAETKVACNFVSHSREERSRRWSFLRERVSLSVYEAEFIHITGGEAAAAAA